MKDKMSEMLFNFLKNNYDKPCHYCGNEVVFTGGLTVYPHREDLKDKIMYVCIGCNAYVGSHENSGTPLGTVADSTLRNLRGKCHQLFDKVWQSNKYSRKGAYSILAHHMEIDQDKCHFALFNVEQCEKALEIINRIFYKRENGMEDKPRNIEIKGRTVTVKRVEKKATPSTKEVPKIANPYSKYPLDHLESLAKFSKNIVTLREANKELIRRKFCGTI